MNDAAYSRGLDNKRKPPIIRFSREARFDSRMTEKNGRSSYIDVDIVDVTSPDGGVTLTKNVKEWFEEIAKKPGYEQWVGYFREMYRDWREAHDVGSVEGTPIANWPLLSPGQVENLLNAGIKSIEDASTMPDDLAAALDGGLYIRSKARYWLNAAEDIGAISARAASLEAENETLKAQVAELGDKLQKANAENQRLTQHFTGKEGFDVIAGRVQPVGLQIVQNGCAQEVPQTVPIESTTPKLPDVGTAVMSADQAQALSMPKLRELAYEHDIKPSNSKDETITRLKEAGKLV